MKCWLATAQCTGMYGMHDGKKNVRSIDAWIHGYMHETVVDKTNHDNHVHVQYTYVTICQKSRNRGGEYSSMRCA